ncbi:MAG: AI-2E family transporter [Oscillospiraceae bacterium]|nr:AI-2E family transporter [Oscillospiraceae bacterium]
MRSATVLLGAAGAVGFLWLAVRFLLPWTAPFLVGWVLAAALEPAVAFLVRRRIPRAAAAALCTVAALAGLIWGLAALVGKGLQAATDFARQLPALAEVVRERLTQLETLAAARLNAMSPAGAALLDQAARGLTQALSTLPAELSARAVALVSRVAQASPNTLLFLVTAALGSYFISAAFPRINAFLLAQLPVSLRRRLEGLGGDLKSGFGGVARAQLILMAMTFFQLLIAFLLLRVEGAVALAAVTALIDALPVFGTGAVLVPWALVILLLGDTRRGLGLLLTWGVTCLVRSCAQAKLLGDQIGLDPLASLLSVYVGWRVCGVWGMLLFPPLLMALIQLNERGVLRLWRSV